MADPKPKIVEGVKYWNVPSDAKAKKAWTREFEVQLRNLFNKLNDEAIKKTGKGLSTQQVSALRNHPDLGIWVVDGKPASVSSVNAFLTGTGRKKVTSLSLTAPKSDGFFNRRFLEHIDNAPREFKNWIDRLDGVSGKGTFWPKGTSLKGFKSYLSQSYTKTQEINKALEAKLGFKFDAGHLWGAMGPKGDRTIIGPLGARSEGKFSWQNVTAQPKSPSLNQLLNPKWDVITPNVPGFYDKAGYQIAGAQDLLDVGAGGQGWSSSLADYMMESSPNIKKLGDLSTYEKAYIAFGDPSKGAGKTPEIRSAQVDDFKLNYTKATGAPKEFNDYIKKGPRTIPQQLGIAEQAAKKGDFVELKKLKIPKPTDVVEDMSKYYISGQEYMEDLAGAPRGTLRREMTTADEAKYLQDKIVMKAQIKPKIKPKNVLNLSNVADTTAKVAKNSRLARLFIPSSAIGVALAPLTIADAHARSKRAEQTGHWLDKAQARLAQAEATADVTGAVPNPVSEAVGFGAGISNLLIDAGRWGFNKVRGEDPIQQF